MSLRQLSRRYTQMGVSPSCPDSSRMISIISLQAAAGDVIGILARAV